MKRFFALSLIICLLTALLPVAACPSVAAETTPLFDEENIILSFGAISDIHIKDVIDGGTTKKYINALEVLKQQAGGKLDAITIAGDISNSTYNSGIGEVFKQVTDAAMGKDANVFFITGNHDAQDGQWDALSQVYTDLAKYTTKDLPSSQHDRGNRHMIIGGYHYIGVNMMDYWNKTDAVFAQQDLEWLDRELASARAAAPGKPIFVYTHAAIYGTTYGSDLDTGNYWGSKAIYNHLKAYPEVITFSGHLHFPIHDQRTIYQKDFTSLNCGSVQYMAIENKYLQTGSKTTIDESSDISNGLLVQVDKKNNVKITRLDFTNNEVIKEPFYIPAPDLTNKTHLKSYDYDYFYTNNTAPTFASNAGVSGVIVGENLEITFDAASDNDMVHHYAMEIKSLPGGKVTKVNAFSEFYFYNQPEDFPQFYTMKVPYALPSGDTTYEIKVYAVDSVGAKSSALSYTYNPNDKPPVISGVENGGTYYTTQTLTVTDTNLDKVLVNGQTVSGTVSLAGNKDVTYNVVAVDKGGNRTVCVVNMKPVSAIADDLAGITEQNVTFTEVLLIDRVLKEIKRMSADTKLSADDKAGLAALKAEMEAFNARIEEATAALNTDAIDATREITAADVTAADKEHLQAALADFNKALATYRGNYTEDTMTAISDEVARVEAALKALGVAVPTTTTTTATTAAPTVNGTTAAPTDAVESTTQPTQGDVPTTVPSSAAPTAGETADESAADKGGSAKKTGPWLFVGIGGAVLLIGGGVLLFLFLRKKKEI